MKSLSNFKELYHEVYFLHCLEYPIQMFLRLIHVEAFIIYVNVRCPVWLEPSLCRGSIRD